ncbi:tripartite tricarboxylate transporter substrate binding protein [Hydrogenophaga sp.]|uniref:Bug family tripartite tricarboxylate transporter substrate binding protein n=1 Tax=Hydrogenophaga sp. TaxID=1904254 RepID=UPI00271BBBAA|nr:tripartite tricarboxylate transporter substrate binding protein [Hydrogenophaga sp.]MDO9436902.1 tripartite tricarboxylate transporter substrate binding protein [Hydrogenophaga sp.]
MPIFTPRATTFARLAAVPALLLAVALPAAAQSDFPRQPITMVVAFPPAGANDKIARIIAPTLAQILGTTIVIDNRPGAGGTIGTGQVAKAKPDGYTITLASMSPTAVGPHVYANLPYKASDLASITTVVSSVTMVALNPKVPATNLAELVALSKTRPVSLASSGTGGSSHLGLERLKAMTGGNFLHVPYKGAAPGLNDAVGGQIDGIIMDYTALSAMVEQGRLRGVVASSKVGNVEKTEHLKDTWYAVLAPAGVPKDIQNKLHAALVKTMADEGVKAQVAKLGFSPMLQSNLDEAAKFIQAENALYGSLVKAAGIVPE